MGVRRRGNGACSAVTSERREDSPLTHRVTMGTRLRSHKTELDSTSRAECNGNGDSITISPIPIRNRKCRLCAASLKVRRQELLNAMFLDLADCDRFLTALVLVVAGLRVGAGDQDGAVLEEDGFAVVVAVDGGVGHEGHALVDWLAWVVEDLRRETLACVPMRYG